LPRVTRPLGMGCAPVEHGLLVMLVLGNKGVTAREGGGQAPKGPFGEVL